MITSLGVSSCSTTYRDSSIPLLPQYVSEATIDYCKECPVYVRDDLSECQVMAAKLAYRNQLDEDTLVEAPDLSFLSILKIW